MSFELPPVLEPATDSTLPALDRANLRYLDSDLDGLAVVRFWRDTEQPTIQAAARTALSKLDYQDLKRLEFDCLGLLNLVAATGESPDLPRWGDGGISIQDDDAIIASLGTLREFHRVFDHRSVVRVFRHRLLVTSRFGTERPQGLRDATVGERIVAEERARACSTQR